MHGLTPYNKLKKSKAPFNSHVLKSPIVLMEDLPKAAGLITMFLKSHLPVRCTQTGLTGKYVYTKCLYSPVFTLLSFSSKMSVYHKCLQKKKLTHLMSVYLIMSVHLIISHLLVLTGFRLIKTHQK